MASPMSKAMGKERSATVKTDVFWATADELFEKVGTGVFWDVEECPIPEGLNAMLVSQNIRRTLNDLNYTGRASIYVYGDINHIRAGLDSTQTPCEVRENAPTRGIRLVSYSFYDTSADPTPTQPEFVVIHTPPGDRKSKLFKIFIDSSFWALDNYLTNLMMILGNVSDREIILNNFSALYSSGHNVLLAQPEKVSLPGSILLALSSKLIWEDLSAGHYPPSKKRKDPEP